MSTLELIGDYIGTLANAKDTMVGDILNMSYSSLASLLLGSQYVSFRSQEVSSLQDKTYSRLVGGAELHSQVSSPLPDSVTFQDIKNKPLGDISR